MNNLTFTEEFHSFASSQQDPIAGGILVSKLVDPEISESLIRARLEELASGLRSTIVSSYSVLEYLKILGFQGAKDYSKSENSSLNYVLNQKRGIPISLALVLMGVSRNLGLTAEGINYPGHFLVRIEGELVDPYGLSVLDERALDADRDGKSSLDKMVASGGQIVVRMLSNLRRIATDNGSYEKALDFSSYQLIVADEPFPIFLERVSLWLALGVSEMALFELDKSLSLAPTEEIREKLTLHRERIKQNPSKLH